MGSCSESAQFFRISSSKSVISIFDGINSAICCSVLFLTRRITFGAPFEDSNYKGLQKRVEDGVGFFHASFLDSSSRSRGTTEVSKHA